MRRLETASVLRVQQNAQNPSLLILGPIRTIIFNDILYIGARKFFCCFIIMQRSAFSCLGFGAKFDRKRFRADAEKLRLTKCSVADSSVKNGSKQDKNSNNASEEKLSNLLETDGVTIFEKSAKRTSSLLPNNESKILSETVDTAFPKSSLKEQSVQEVRRKHRIFVFGDDIPPPCCSFEELYALLVPKLVQNVKALNFRAPTPIQMQAIPILLAGREVMASAPTGSGKTLAFLIPAVNFLLTECESENILRILIIEPTYELSKQVYLELLKLTDGLNVKVHLTSNAPQLEDENNFDKENFDIMVTTPNRLIYAQQQSQPLYNLNTIKWLIIDECDKLFESGDRGFRKQLSKIYQQCDTVKIRRLLFSATFSYELEQWCKINLNDMVMVCVGARNSAVQSVKQELVFVGSEHGKVLALRNMFIEGFTPPVLIFVQSKDRAEQLYNEFKFDEVKIDYIHSDLPKKERENAIKKFRRGDTWILICTELIGRGLDFKCVNLVINFDFPTSSISYIHRIGKFVCSVIPARRLYFLGRTGRAGRQGRALTFFTETDKLLLRSIGNIIQAAGCPVPDYILKLPKASKKVRMTIASSAPKRDPISEVVSRRSDRYQKFKRKKLNEARMEEN
ncbi:putative ATP-dependent RNA helicase DDX52 [Trichinella sp. T6]|nr:putative ATP-dependent RNA helicase DDX52 [Trichinella sp. T6]